MSLSQLRSPVVIVGMHRSGSTLLTRVLESCDIFWGAEVDIYNEAKCFQRSNERLLTLAGATWDHPKSLFQFLQDEKRLNFSRRNIYESLNSDFVESYLGNHRICTDWQRWGWKDPRNTFSIPVWEKIFPSMQVIHIVRNGIDVAASLWKRETARPKEGDPHFSPMCQNIQQCFNLWKTYVITARQNVKNMKKVIQIHFEDLLEHPENTVKSIIDFLGLNPTAKMHQSFRIINPKKRFAFKKDKALVDFWHLVKKDELLNELGYEFH